MKVPFYDVKETSFASGKVVWLLVSDTFGKKIKKKKTLENVLEGRSQVAGFHFPVQHIFLDPPQCQRFTSKPVDSHT